MLVAALSILQKASNPDDADVQKLAFEAADQASAAFAGDDSDLQYDLSLYLKDDLLADAQDYLTGNFKASEARILKELLIEQELQTKRERNLRISETHLHNGFHRMRQAALSVFRENGDGARELAVRAAVSSIEDYVKKRATNDTDLKDALLEKLPDAVRQAKYEFEQMERENDFRP